MTRLTSTCWWIILALWCTAVLSPAITSISAFTQLKEVGLVVTEYQDFLGDDSELHGRMAAGYISTPVFNLTDRTQAILALAATMVFVSTRGKVFGFRSPLNILNGVILILLCGLSLWIYFDVSPSMNSAVEAYRVAAAANDTQEAALTYKSMMIIHETSEPLYGARAILVFILIIASGILSGTPKTKTTQS